MKIVGRKRDISYNDICMSAMLSGRGGGSQQDRQERFRRAVKICSMANPHKSNPPRRKRRAR